MKTNHKSINWLTFRRTQWLFAAVAVIMLLELVVTDATAQTIDDAIANGEYPVAIKLARTLPPDQQDAALLEVAVAQASAGVSQSALDTASLMSSDDERSQTSDAIAESLFGTPVSAGGITEGDFQPLIELIQGTVVTDSWRDTGQGEGSLIPFVSGVWVDGTGLLNRIKVNDKSMQFLGRAPVATPREYTDLFQSSQLRTVSLTRLHNELLRRSAQGRRATEAMQNLAGLTSITFISFDPDSGEILIAGPAGGWVAGENGRVINDTTEAPVLQLDDFVVAVRNAWRQDADRGKFGCAIVPEKSGLAAAKDFLLSHKSDGTLLVGLRAAMGPQNIEVFGIDANTHAAAVLVEADYRMKLVGMGLEQSIASVPSYLQRLKPDADGTLPPVDVVRWWFTSNYDHVITNKSRDLFTFSGPGVKVLSENEKLADDGDRIHTGHSSEPTKGFADDFTEHFDVMAQQFPIYRELKNVFDMAVVANLIYDHRPNAGDRWTPVHFLDTGSTTSYRLRRGNAPQTVDSVINERQIRQRMNGRTLKHQIVAVSGGVTFNATSVIKPDRMVVEDDVEFVGLKKEMQRTVQPAVRWWWD